MKRQFSQWTVCYPVFLLGALTAWGILFFGCGQRNETGNAKSESDVPQRVVSLSPALTEIMFSLGLDSKVVGVTAHCKYPPEAQRKTQVGTIFTPNFEAMSSLKPDCALLASQDVEKIARIRSFGWRPEVFQDKTIEDVFETIHRLGRLFDATERADQLVEEMRGRLETLRKKTQGNAPVRVLLVVSRNYESSRLEEVYLAGRDGLCEPLLEIAGGKNVYSGSMPFPKVSAEGLLSMEPDLILEIVPDEILKKTSKEALDSAWLTLPSLKAVRNRKIFHIAESEAALIPGPSMVLWAEKAADVLKNSE